MPIQIAAHHVEVTACLRERISEKATHMRRIFDGITTLHVTVTAEKERRTAELVANVSHGAPVVAKVTAASLDAAIQEVFEKVEAQLRRHKDKIRDHRLHEGQPELATAAASEGADDADEMQERESGELDGTDAAEEAR